ncbi:MAG: GTPase [Candidatus Aenigmatarchaeota archaeon]
MSMSGFWDIVESVINNSDFVIEVIDARMPEMTRNEHAEDLVRKKGKKLIIVANKSDFLSKEAADLYKKNVKDVPFFFVSIRNRKGVTALKRKLFKIIEKRKNDSLINIGVIGYPNTGKSSLINALCGRRAIIAGSRPGTTRCDQLVKMSSNIMLIDTPGVIPLSDCDETKQMLMNSLDPSDAKRIDLAATEIVRIFLEQNRKTFEGMYSVKTDGKSFEEIVEEIGKSKKMLIKGGKVDARRVCLKIIDDWQKGNMLLKDIGKEKQL